MLTIQQIENQEYTLNQVADLKMRLDYAMKQLNYISNHTFKKGEELMCIHAIYETVETSLILLNAEHDRGEFCDVTPHPSGMYYICGCGKVAGQTQSKGE